MTDEKKKESSYRFSGENGLSLTLTLPDNPEPVIQRGPMGVNQWCEEAYRVAKEKGWYDAECDKSPTEEMALLHCEVSEVIEQLRDGRGLNETYFKPEKPTKPEGVPSEFADIFLRLTSTAHKFGINLEAAIVQKHEYNKTREKRHGKKF